MALVGQGVVVAPQNNETKSFTEVRQSDGTAGSRLAPSLLVAKWNPQWDTIDAARTKVTSATIEQQVSALVLARNTVTDPAIAVTYAGQTLQAVLDEINGFNDNENGVPVRRWRAGLRDVQPQFLVVASAGLVVAAASALKGEHGEPVYVSADVGTTLNAMFCGCGFGGAERGKGAFWPDFFETGYEYGLNPVTTPGDVGRAGAIRADAGEGSLPQKSAKFTKREPIRARQEIPGRSSFQTYVEEIVSSVGHTLTVTHVMEVWDAFGNLIWQDFITPVGNEARATPRVLVEGPAFVVDHPVAGSTIGTQGFMTVTGEHRLA